ncbi:hypothetical protein GQ600_4311 [Phytophthora cactorum]|nr:hypothetical protein GQ600_4311 [Phytophthora cactorum]
MRYIDAFKSHVLGIRGDGGGRMHCRPGLFGLVKAYFGMVETQGGGTLHAHFLVWLSECYPNSESFERSLREQEHLEGAVGEIERSIEAYTDSIVSTDLTLPVDDYECVICGCSFRFLEELPIPAESMTNGFYKCSVGERNKLNEPLLARCGNCKTAVSSQHVIKQVLDQARPNTWPPSMIELTPEQIHNQALLEAFWRNDIEKAREVIAQREHLRGLCNNFSEDSFDYGDHENTEQDRLYDDYLVSLAFPQGRYMRREDDPFREDTITRAIESSPPSPDDMRMSEKSFQFMVSTLVVLLNVHWWAHAGSCFKKSRSTNTNCICRYLFPRNRVPRTNFHRTGVRLCRRVARELVNG